MLPRCFIGLIYRKLFHCSLEVLAAFEIPADIIGLSSNGLPLAHGRGKEIAILLVFLNAAVNIFHSIILLLIFSVFRRRKNKRKRKIFPLSVLFIAFRQGLPKAMHLALDGKGVSVYTSPPKDKRLVCLRHFLDHFRADRTHDFAVRYTGEVICKDILEPVFFVSRFAEYILV